jgi:hypothetical protein
MILIVPYNVVLITEISPYSIWESIMENLSTVEIDTNFGNHMIQGKQPRMGVGIVDQNHFVLIVVDGCSRGYSRGATLTEFAGMLQELGCSQAYNLDGGDLPRCISWAGWSIIRWGRIENGGPVTPFTLLSNKHFSSSLT